MSRIVAQWMSARRLSIAVGLLLPVAGLGSGVLAAPVTFDDLAAGNWTDAATWTPAPPGDHDFPTAGDTVLKNSAVIVTVPTAGGNQSFGGNGTTSSWSSGGITIGVDTTLTHLGGGILNYTGSDLDLNTTGTGTTRGTFVNSGAWRQNVNQRLDLNAAGFLNSGTYTDITTGTAASNMLTIRASGLFRNTGTLLKSGTHVERRIEGPGGTFDNTGGTVESSQGLLDIGRGGSPGLVITGYTSGSTTISQGTWIASGTGSINFIGANSSTNRVPLTTIGSAAKIVLADSGTITQIGAALATVQGTFGVRSGKVFTAGTALATPGRLEFGLDAADGFNGTRIDITGDANFTGGTVDVLDLGLTEGTYRLINWTGARTGELTLGATPANGFTYSLITSGTNGGFVDLQVVPEPGIVGILGAATAAGLLRRRRVTHAE